MNLLTKMIKETTKRVDLTSAGVFDELKSLDLLNLNRKFFYLLTAWKLFLLTLLAQF
jgi:hypothetical protein